MKIKNNKKGFVIDTLVASAALFVVVLVIAVVALILFNFNSEIQNHNAVGEEAKLASAEAESTFPPILGYAFGALFLGFLIYTIVTAILINNIHPIFWIVGFVLTIISTVITSTIKLIFGAVETTATLAPYIADIPMAGWYFSNIEIINIVWIILQLTIIYFTWER